MKSWRVRTLSTQGPCRPLLLTFLLILLPCSGATADTLRCGSHLIQNGDDAFSVIDKCGEPTNRQIITEPIYASNGNGGTYPTGEVSRTEVWRYDRGPQSFPVIIKIADGVVQSIRFVKTPR